MLIIALPFWNIEMIVIFYTRYVSRPIAALLVVPLSYTPVTPNQITLLTLVVHSINMWLLFHGHYFLTGVGFFLSQILDCLDGQLAREEGKISQFGTYLDLAVDFIRETSFFLVLMFISYPIRGWQLLNAMALFILLQSFYMDWMRKSIAPTPSGEEKESSYEALKRKLGLRFWNIGARHFVYTVCLMIGRVDFIIYYVLSIGLVLTLQKYYRNFFRYLPVR